MNLIKPYITNEHKELWLMFCANISEQQISCKICLENRLFDQPLSLKSLLSQTSLVPPAQPAPQMKRSAHISVQLKLNQAEKSQHF